MSSSIKRASSKSSDVIEALKEISLSTQAKEAQFTLIFFSSNYDLKKLAQFIPTYLGPRVYGCSTSGEIGPAGIIDNSISAISFHGSEFKINSFFIDNLKDFNIDLNPELNTLIHQVEVTEHSMGESAKTMAFFMIDGMSAQEEIVTGRIANLLHKFPLFGGSAGDNLKFKDTWIWNGHSLSENCALVLLLTTVRPFEIFKTQHFTPSDSKIVITASEPEKRIVYEIDGMPAAEAYSELLDIDIKDFSPEVFSKYPIMLNMGNECYIRSIQKVNPDLSLTFYCAIEDGLVLTLANRDNLFDSVRAEFNRIKNNIGEIDSALLCECILRKIEIDSLKPTDRFKIASFYANIGAVGFHTYGEQYGSIHVNQTMTGVAFAKSKII